MADEHTGPGIFSHSATIVSTSRVGSFLALGSRSTASLPRYRSSVKRIYLAPETIAVENPLWPLFVIAYVGILLVALWGSLKSTWTARDEEGRRLSGKERLASLGTVVVLGVFLLWLANR